MSTLRCLLVIVGAMLFAAAGDTHAGPAIERWTTTNGATVLFVPAPEIPMYDVRFSFAAGSARDGDKKGVAALTSRLLNAGAGDYDVNEFSRRLGATGGILSVDSRRDVAFVNLRSLTRKDASDAALTLLELVLGSPRFDDDAIERARAQALVGFRHKQQSPGTLVDEAMYRAVYGDHPYATPEDGTAETVAALTRADIVAFHQRYYVAGNAVIAIVGALDRAAAEAMAERLSAALPRGEAAPPLPEVAAPEGGVVQIEHPSIQSHVRVAQPGMRRGDPDYFPLLVGNHALGGNSLVSLLFEEVRNKRGLSYSAYSYFLPMDRRGPFVAALQTDRQQQDEAIRVMRETLNDFIRNGPPAEAFAAARQNLIGGFPLRIDSNSKLVEYLAMIGYYDLPLDYLDTFVDKVRAVTPEAVADAFARRIDPAQLVTIIVGRNEAEAAAAADPRGGHAGGHGDSDS